MTVGSHDSGKRTSVKGCDDLGSYSRKMPCLLQLRSLAATLNHCEQFVTYECDGSRLSGRGWWVSRNRTKMNYSGGAFPGSGKCACEMSDTCHSSDKSCNCNANIDGNELEDS